MAHPKELTIRASRVPNRNSIYIFGDLFGDNPDTCMRADKLRLVPSKLYLSDDITSMCTITQEAAQLLIDDLYKLGFRASTDEGDPV